MSLPLRASSTLLLLLTALACSSMSTPGLEAAAFQSECPHPGFDGHREISEAGSLSESTDPCWWLSSGGLFWIAGGTARTIQGPLPPDSKWHGLYAASSPVDTDAGTHPQNLLRLVTRARWADYRQDVRFRITRINQSTSPQRGEWSGVLLFQRYQDSQNLYYAGLRMDGTAVIKKKLAGKYTTMAQAPVFGSPQAYSRDARPCLLPMDSWIEMASEISTNPDRSVHIALLGRDATAPDGWRPLVEATDNGRDGPPIREAGHGGLRGDFMDVEFSGYSVTAKNN